MSTTVPARIGSSGKYKDGTQTLEVYILKRLAKDLPYREGERIAVTLNVGGIGYNAGMRTTSRYDYVWICPDVYLPSGKKTELGRILPDAGFSNNQSVTLIVDDTVLTLSHAGSLPGGAPNPPAIDLEKAPDRIEVIEYRIVRDTVLAWSIKKIHNYQCQVCGHFIEFPNGDRYAEAHHIRPLGGIHKGPDVSANIMCVCPNHHAELDMLIRKISLTELRSAPGHEVESRFIDYHNSLVDNASSTI